MTPEREGTVAAFRAACGAAVPSEEDDSMTKIAAFFRWKDETQLVFDFNRVLAVGQP